MSITSDRLAELRKIDLTHLGKAEAKEFTVLLEELSKREFQEESTSTFMQFVKVIWSDFIEGDHHYKMAAAFIPCLPIGQKSQVKNYRSHTYR